MKLLIDKKEIQGMVENVYSFQKNTKLKKESNIVKMEAKGDTLFLSFNYKDKSIIIKTTDTSIKEEGRLFIDFNKIFKSIKSLSDGILTISDKNQQLTMESVDFNINIDLVNFCDEISSKTETKECGEISFNTNHLIESLDKVIFIHEDKNDRYDKTHMVLSDFKAELFGVEMRSIGYTIINNSSISANIAGKYYFNNPDLQSVYNVLVKNKHNFTLLKITDNNFIFEIDNIIMIIKRDTPGMDRIKERYTDLSNIRDRASVSLKRKTLIDYIKKFIAISKANDYTTEGVILTFKDCKIIIGNDDDTINATLPDKIDYNDYCRFNLFTNNLQEILEANKSDDVYFVFDTKSNKTLIQLIFNDDNSEYLLALKQE